METSFGAFITLFDLHPPGPGKTAFLLEFAEESMQTCPIELVSLLSEAEKESITDKLFVEAALCNRLLGWIAYDKGDLAPAKTYFLNGLELLAREDDEMARLRILNGLASVHLDQAEYAQAMTVYREALAIAERLGDECQTGIVEGNLAEVLYLQGRLDEAETLTHKTLAGGKLSRLNICLGHNLLAKIHIGQKKIPEARSAASHAVEMARSGGFTSALATALAQLGTIELMDGHFETAEKLLMEVRSIAGPAGDGHAEVLAAVSLGRLELQKKDPQAAVRLFEDAIDLSRKNGAVIDEAEALHGLADSLRETGRYREALEAYAEFHELSERLHHESVSRQITQYTADQNRRETEMWREQTRILTILGDLGQSITASLKLEDIVLTLYKSIGTLMKAETFGLSLYDRETETLDFCLFVEDGALVPPFKIPLTNDTFTSWCLRNKKDILINDVDREFRKYLSAIPKTFGNRKIAKSCLYVPMLVEGEVIGVLSAQSCTGNAYTEIDRASLRNLAASVSVAVQNARLFDQLHRMATVDTLTGAATRRFLFERTEEEFQRFKRDNGALALVMFDLDHFKNVNDTWGHQTGDAALTAFGAFCLARKRPHDLFGRYGGEEFVLILSGTTIDGARVSAERLRAQLEKLDIPAPDGQVLHITASFGITSFDGRDEDITRAFARADTALYKAKRAGRNRVAVQVRKKIETARTGKAKT